MDVHKWHNEVLGNRVVEALKRNNFDAVYFDDKNSAVGHILGYVSEGDKVGIGGSTTVSELGLLDELAERGAEVLYHNLPGLSPEQRTHMRRAQIFSDVFITSTNALTEEGWLFNVDGSGNRVAAMIFGPKKTIVVAGMNKVVSDLQAAYDRVCTIAAPKNNKRIGLPNPCTLTGVCMDCDEPTRICNAYTLLKKRPSETDFTVVLIGEDLGY